MKSLLCFPLLPLLVTCPTFDYQHPFVTHNNHNDDHFNDLSIPGSNPFAFCTDPKPYILQISSLNFSLSEAKGNTRTMSISLDTHLIQAIAPGAGALIHLARKLDGKVVDVKTLRVDLCEELEERFDIQCPVKSGVETREREVAFRDGRAGVEWALMVDAWVREGERLVCFEGVLG